MKSILVSLMLIILSIGMISSVNAENVPDWVKNTAGWWADDAISEKEFVNAIEFLVNEGIISVSSTNVAKSSELVPDWVKNTAGWWADDAISEKEFVNAIEFLIQTDVISISSTSDYPKYSSIDEIMNDESLSTFEKLVEIDYLFPLFSGYRGATFDGEFVYYSPYYSNHGRHTEMIQYNTSLDFDNPEAWSHISIPINNKMLFQGGYIDVSIGGFQGVLFKEPFVYYVPYHVENEYGSVILRYDTRMEFTNLDSFDWKGNFDVYEDGTVHDNFIYFSPHLDYKNERNTIPMRYDTTKPFVSNSSWERIDVEKNTSYIDALAMQDKIYYAPWQTSDLYDLEIMIYDTKMEFTDVKSWKFIEIPYRGYTGVEFTGEYVVFIPGWCSIYDCDENDSNFIFLEPNTLELKYLNIPNSAYNGVVNAKNILYPVPYYENEKARFLEIDGFEFKIFSPEKSNTAYWGGVFDGQYVYYAPYTKINSEIRSNEFLRYDTEMEFDDEDAWEEIILTWDFMYGDHSINDLMLGR